MTLMILSQSAAPAIEALDRLPNVTKDLPATRPIHLYLPGLRRPLKVLWLSNELARLSYDLIPEP